MIGSGIGHLSETLVEPKAFVDFPVNQFTAKSRSSRSLEAVETEKGTVPERRFGRKDLKPATEGLWGT